MDAEERAQVRLILDTLSERAAASCDDALQALYASMSAKRMLRSGNTIRSAIRTMEETAAQLIKNAVDDVSAVAMATDAFAMINESLELFLSAQERKIDGIVELASGKERMGSARGAASLLFNETAARLRRQLELHRFTFIRSASPIRPLSLVAPTQPTAPAPATPAPQKAKGGRPPAEFWDDMWAAIAVQLFDGTLQPKTQADIERAMSDWIASKGLDAGNTTVRARARRLWDAIGSSDD